MKSFNNENKNKSYGPFIKKNGKMVWWLDDKGMFHREDGPAVIRRWGRKEWRWHGKFHREDGPASVYPDGYISWWWYGDNLTFKNWCRVSKKTDEEIVQLKLQYF